MDGGYDRTQLMDKAVFLDFVVEIVRKMEGQKGLQVLPRRWVVERTFAWMPRWRSARARLRTTHRRLRGHDPPRHEKSPTAKD